MTAMCASSIIARDPLSASTSRTGEPFQLAYVPDVIPATSERLDDARGTELLHRSHDDLAHRPQLLGDLLLRAAERHRGRFAARAVVAGSQRGRQALWNASRGEAVDPFHQCPPASRKPSEEPPRKLRIDAHRCP